jgi:hypothetical protein
MPEMNNLFFYPPTQLSSKGSFVKASTWYPSDRFIDRVVRSYQIAASEFGGSGDSMWTAIAGRQAEIHSALMADDKASLFRLLSSPELCYLYYGVDNLFPDHIAEMRNSAEELQRHASLIADHIFRLAEALGVQRVIRPSGNPGDEGPKQIDAEDLLRKIERRLQTELRFHNPFNGEFGLETSFGLVSYRSLLAVYQAWRLIRLRSRSVLEIGAGMGRTVVFSRSLGITDYTVIDLPMTLVGQACFIAASIGEDSVHLLGDELPPQGRICLVPPSRLQSLERTFDVVLNVNSITELDLRHAKEYSDFAMTHARLFLSINHEQNAFRAADLVDEMSCQVDRYPYWMRKGYVEEIFTPQVVR